MFLVYLHYRAMQPSLQPDLKTFLTLPKEAPCVLIKSQHISNKEPSALGNHYFLYI